jgi:hypothetical protein
MTARAFRWLPVSVSALWLLAACAGDDDDAQNGDAGARVDGGASGGAGASANAGTGANAGASGRDAGRAGTPRDGAVDSGATDAGAAASDAGSTRDPNAPPCFAAAERPQSDEAFGFALPSLEDERETYRRLGWTWAPSAEPSAPAEPDYSVEDVDIHGDTEGDDLWSYLAAEARTAQPGYRDRAEAWARYFKDDYAQCVGSDGASFCYDRDSFGGDHLWGWGLISYGRLRDDAAALPAAERIGAQVETLWGPDTPYGCVERSGCTYYGVRLIGRHLLFMTRLAEVSSDARWSALRDRIIETLLEVPEWDEMHGTYFEGDWSTDQALGEGAFAAGARIQSPFMLGVLSEGMDHAYRATGNAELRRRMIEMAAFVDEHGLDAEYRYTGSLFGVVSGQTWHNYAAEEPVEFWDPVYTTSLVNVLMRGYRYSCDAHYLERAALFFIRGNGAIYGEPTMRSAADGVVHHFVDTRFDSSTGNFFLDYNKGELQYTHLLFAR